MLVDIENIINSEDLNGYVGKINQRVERVNGGWGFGKRNQAEEKNGRIGRSIQLSHCEYILCQINEFRKSVNESMEWSLDGIINNVQENVANINNKNCRGRDFGQDTGGEGDMVVG